MSGSPEILVSAEGRCVLGKGWQACAFHLPSAPTALQVHTYVGCRLPEHDCLAYHRPDEYLKVLDELYWTCKRGVKPMAHNSLLMVSGEYSVAYLAI